jgi:uncharacterized glyoxalase superfamily protein PhnB
MTHLYNTKPISVAMIKKKAKGSMKMYKGMTTNLMVESVDKAIAFYQDILGFSTVTSVPGKTGGLQFAILSKDGLMLMVEEKGALIEEYPILNTPEVHPSVSLYITVDDFDALYTEIKGKYPINTELHTSFYGAREFAIADTDGYVLTFTEQKNA